MQRPASTARVCATTSLFSSPRRFAGLIALMTSAALPLSGCAGTKMARLMPHVENMRLAEHYFGEPSAKTLLPNGETRNEWLLDRVTQAPGQYVEEKIFVGHDRDGFPVYHTRTVFVPAHLVRQRCRLEILSDRSDRVLESSWKGDSCDELLLVPSTY